MRLKNNDMVALNFSITGFDDLDKYSQYSLPDVNIHQNQVVSTLSLPPANSSVFLYNASLYAFTSSIQDTDYDVCGDGVLQLLRYDSNDNSWIAASDTLTFSDVNDISFYAYSSYLVTDQSSTIYIYGGRCSSGEVTNRMLSFDMDTMMFSNISTSTKPQAFYGASALWAPNPQNLLVIGGKSSAGWINMYQLATWNFQSGWLFQLAKLSDTSTMSSRTNSLVLPVFSPLSDNSTSTFISDYKVNSVLTIGGDTGSGASANWSMLSLSSNEWTWAEMTTSVNVNDVLGAAVIFDTLVVVNGSSFSKRDTSASYTLSLYNISNLLAQVTDVKSNTIETSNSSSGTSTSVKVAIGVLVPLAVISLIACGALFYFKKRADHQQNDLNTVDYPLGHFRTALDNSYDPLRPHSLYKNSNDTGSTLEVGSIDLWVRKRHEYDAKRLRTLKRHSYLASNETLNGHLIDRREQPEIDDDDSLGEGRVSESRLSAEGSDSRVSREDDLGEARDSKDHEGTDIVSQEVPQVGNYSPRKVLHKSFSYSHTPPQLPHIKKSRLDPGYIDLGQMMMTEENIEDSDSFDEDMDVQVLVSSKRKSVLRVMNPDEEDAVEIRLRAPSN